MATKHTIQKTVSATSSASVSGKLLAKSISSMKCLVTEDTNDSGAPVHLWQLFSKYDAEKLTQGEAVFLLCYLMALETGFIPLLDKQQHNHLKLTPTLPFACFNAANVRKITNQQQLPPYTKDSQLTVFSIRLQQLVETYNHQDEDILAVNLIAIVSGDLLLLTLSPIEQPQQTYSLRGFSTCIPIARYVLNMNLKGKPIYQRFRKLNELSLLLHNNIFIPMRLQQLHLLGVGPFPGLHGLPNELYDRILAYLATRDKKAFASLNQRLHYYCINSKYWKKSKKLTFDIESSDSIGTVG